MPRGYKRRPRKGPKGPTLNKRLATVERQLRAGRETKIVRVSGEINFSSVINTSKLLNILPDIPQSTASSGRIGNEIRLKKLVIKSWMRYAPLDVNNRVPLNEAIIMARAFILRQKDQMSSPGLLTGSNFVGDALLESGEFNQANEFRNVMSPLNKDLFVAKQDRKFQLTNATDTSDPNSDAEANPYPFKINNKTITFGKMGKKLTYLNEEGVVQPVQFPWVYTAGYTNVNGTPASFSQMFCQYDITAYYTDA